MRQHGDRARKHELHLAAQQIGQRLRQALVGHVHDPGPRHQLEQFSREVSCAAYPV